MPLIQAVATLFMVGAPPVLGGDFHPVAAPEMPSQGAAESIGTATMDAHGTILLQLRAEGPGIIGDALLRYRQGETGYDAVRSHLPALRPGTTVMVPPFR